MEKSLLSVVVICCVSIIGLEAYKYTDYQLYHYCGRTIELPCERLAERRAGTLTFSGMLRADECAINVTVHLAPIDCHDRYAIYFNIRDVDMGDSSRVQIKGNSTSGNDWNAVKTMSGIHKSKKTWPVSVAQYMSPYEELPVVSLSFQGTPETESIRLKVDYTVMHKSGYVGGETSEFIGEAYCDALEGHTLEELICDDGDRVNCPSAYSDSDGTGNPATATAYNGSRYCRLSVGAVVGISLGALAAVIIGVVLACLLCRRRRRKN